MPSSLALDTFQPTILISKNEVFQELKEHHKHRNIMNTTAIPRTVNWFPDAVNTHKHL